MSYLNLPKREELDHKTRELWDDAENRWGYVPNLVKVYALAPDVIAAEDVWSKGIMHNGYLPRRLKEAIATTVSTVNQCNYCSTSHAFAYTIAGGSEEQARSCKSLSFDDFDEKERAALDFTQKAASDPKAITKEDINKLREHYSDKEIVEIATVIQQFMGYNWFVTILGLELEETNPMKNLKSVN